MNLSHTFRAIASTTFLTMRQPRQRRSRIEHCVEIVQQPTTPAVALWRSVGVGRNRVAKSQLRCLTLRQRGNLLT